MGGAYVLVVRYHVNRGQSCSNTSYLPSYNWSLYVTTSYATPSFRPSSEVARYFNSHFVYPLSQSFVSFFYDGHGIFSCLLKFSAFYPWILKLQLCSEYVGGIVCFIHSKTAVLRFSVFNGKRCASFQDFCWIDAGDHCILCFYLKNVKYLMPWFSSPVAIANNLIIIFNCISFVLEFMLYGTLIAT